MDGTNVYALEVQGDFLNKQTFAKPAQALAELIWNSLDADATVVDVTEDSYSGFGSRIIISDNGLGFSHADAPNLFRHLGGSWKHFAGGVSRTRKRFLHGSEGKGRLKALSLGRVVDWEVCHQSELGYHEFTVSMLGNSLKEVHVSMPQLAKQKFPGVRCIISELSKPPEFLYSQKLHQELSSVFAIYLKNYPDVQITLPAGKLDMAIAIASNKVEKLPPIVVDGKSYPVELEIIGWRHPTDRTLYLCNAAGLPLMQSEIRLQMPGINFSAYLKSPYMSVLSHKGILELAEMTSEVADMIASAKDALKKFYIALQSAFAESIVGQWKQQDIYPFEQAPQNLLERIEREVFDIVAIKVRNMIPGFDSAPTLAKKLQLRMLRQAIEKYPDELQTILTDVLALSPRKEVEFARLLKENSITATIGGARVISERLAVLKHFEALMHADSQPVLAKEKKPVLEQIQHLLTDNTWMFGEKFVLSGENTLLVKVLQKHIKAGNNVFALREVSRQSNANDAIAECIVARSIVSQHDHDEEHLVVELKSPRFVFGPNEISNVLHHVQAIQNDEDFSGKNVRWTYWIVTNNLGSDLASPSLPTDRPTGLVFQSTDKSISIYVKNWTELVHVNQQRLTTFTRNLEANAHQDGSLEFLRERFARVLNAEKKGAEDAPTCSHEV
jgi:hypothetical protein